MSCGDGKSEKYVNYCYIVILFQHALQTVSVLTKLTILYTNLVHSVGDMVILTVTERGKLFRCRAQLKVLFIITFRYNVMNVNKCGSDRRREQMMRQVNTEQKHDTMIE